MNGDKLVFDVVGALIEKNGKYLLCKRMENDRFGSLWEFPGGKVEDGESREDALKREIKEELAVELEVKNLVDTFEDEIPEMKIIVYLYSAVIAKGKLRPVECQDFKWAGLDEIKSLALAPADKKIYLHLLNSVKNKK